LDKVLGEIMVLAGVSILWLLGILAAAVYVYLLFYNTNVAIAIAIGVFEFLWKVLLGLFRVLYNIISWIMDRFRR
jgi:hypothetical protein